MISVVIPALNEEIAIGATIAGVSEVLAAANLVPFEIVVVDDGSSDQTGKIAAAAGAKVIRHPHNVGYGRSLKNGIAAAQPSVTSPTAMTVVLPTSKLTKGTSYFPVVTTTVSGTTSSSQTYNLPTDIFTYTG